MDPQVHLSKAQADAREAKIMAWDKEECRRYYRQLKEKLTELREGRVTPPGQRRLPLSPNESKTWIKAAERFWQLLQQEGAAHLSALAAEEGPLSALPGGAHAELAEARRRLQEAQRQEAEKWARLAAQAEQAEAQASAFRDFMWARLTQEDPPAEAMAKLAEFAAKDKEASQATIWQEVGQIDWEPAVQQVSQWMGEALQKLAQAEQADLVTIQLGDAPEVFAVEGVPWPGGQKKMAACLKALRKGSGRWTEKVDWDSSQTLAYQKTATLPGEVWKQFPLGNPKARFAGLADMMIWDVIARLGIARALRQPGLDWAGILGARKCVGLVLGYEEPEYIGSLTLQGWDTTK